MRRALVPLLAAALVSGLVGLVPTARAGSETTATPTTDVTVGSCRLDGQLVPDDYLGLSIEWSMVPYWFGTSTATAVPSTVALLRNLTASSTTGGVLRIGGSSQDGYRWAPDGDQVGNKLFFGRITTGMVDALLEVARQSGWKLVLGLNLRDDQPEEAAALVRYAASQDRSSSLLAVAPGNEPDSYMASTEAYLERYGRYVDALDADPVTREVPLTGPDLSNGADLSVLEALRRAHSSRLAFVGWHDYGNRPSLEKLLSPQVQERFLGRVATASQGAAMTPSRMSEGNSVGHGGLRQVSDVTGSTAWVVDTVLSGAAAGLAGYNLHAWDNHYYQEPGWTARYTPFFVREGMTYPAPGVYALALLREMSGKRFCDVTTADLAAPAGSTVKAWALGGNLTDRSLAVYLVNKGTRSELSERVRVALPAGPVTMSRIVDLRGCSGRSTTVNSSVLGRDGTLTWKPAPLQRAADGTVELTLSPCQTALLEVQRDGLLSLP